MSYWDKYEPSQEKAQDEPKQEESSYWEKYEPKTAEEFEEPFKQEEKDNALNDLRTLYQFPAGVAQALTGVLSTLNFIGHNEARADVDEVEEAAKKEGVPFDRQKYLDTIDFSEQYFPTLSNAERGIENATGLPLQPKDKLQSLIRLGTGIGTLTPGKFGAKATAGTTAAGISGGLREAGVPDQLSDIIGGFGSQAPKAVFDSGKRIFNNRPSAQARNLERDIIGQGSQGTPKSYENADAALKALQLPEIASTEAQAMTQASQLPKKPLGPSPLGQAKGDLSGKNVQQGTAAESQAMNQADLTGRNVKQGLGNLGIRPVRTEQQANPGQKTINDLYPLEYANTSAGGEALTKQIRRADEKAYRNVNQLYNQSKEANSNVVFTHTQLAGQLANRLADLEAIPHPSGPQNQLKAATKDILKEIAELDDVGNVIGYKDIENQKLIEQVQSLRQKVDFDFTHGNAKNIFKPLINEIEDSALRAAYDSGNPQAAEKLYNAKASYKDWSQTFDNDYMRPYRDLSNRDFSKNFQSATSIDNARVVKSVLDKSVGGEIIWSGIERELVNKELGKFFADPRKYDPKEFTKAARELVPVIGDEKVGMLKESFNEMQRRTFSASKKETPKQAMSESKAIATKYLGKKPEDVRAMLDSRSDIKEVRKDLKDQPQLFEKIAQDKMRSILREGNVEKNFTGDDLYKVLNKEHNYEIFSELLGPEATEEFRLAAKDIGKNQVRIDNASKLIKDTTYLKLFKTIFLP